MTEDVWSHFGNWWGVAIVTLVYGIFVAFVPFYKKSQTKPSGVFLGFVVAYALEMFGVPMSMYGLTWLLGRSLPEGILWGHTLVGTIGFWGMYVGAVFSVSGMAMVVLGWRDIYKNYWSKEEGRGRLVTTGIYSRVRHPQYTGFLLITLGMLSEWATLPLLVMWSVLAVIYYRLARREESDMEAEFGEEYLRYRQVTGMFLPRAAARPIRAKA
jgi:protein-S-isoprenylcysteine O-methyltransferase Ste14